MFFIKEENLLLVVPQYFVKMETNWKSIFFQSVDELPMEQMHIGLLFIQRNGVITITTKSVCKNDGEVSLG